MARGSNTVPALARDKQVYDLRPRKKLSDTGGAPSKLTPERVEKICEFIAKGAPFSLAAPAAGITYTTFKNWNQLAAQAEEDGEVNQYTEFANMVKQAEALAAMKDLEAINKAIEDGIWQASAWKLERRFKKEFGRHETHEHTGGEKPIRIDLGAI